MLGVCAPGCSFNTQNLYVFLYQIKTKIIYVVSREVVKFVILLVAQETVVLL